MNLDPTEIEGVVLVKPEIYEDRRGYFLETYREEWYENHELIEDLSFVQDNLSYSVKNTIRGLHYQISHQQAKLIMVPRGTILDVAVDLRQNSPTFGKYVSTLLSDENKHQLFIAKGFAHGFSVLSDEALVYYKCSDYYHRKSERGLNWSDPDLNIDWQVETPIVSDKDQHQPKLKEIPKKDLF